MTQRVEFPQATNLGNVAEPSASQDAATKNYVDTRPGGAQYFDDVILVSTGNVTLGIGVVGETGVVIAGNVTANYRAGDVLVFLNDRFAPRYTVTFVNFVGGNTNVTFNSPVLQYIPNGTTIYKTSPTRQIYTDLKVADSLSGSVTNNVLTLDAIIENIPLVNIATAFKHGILTLGVGQSVPNLTINGEIGSFIGDNSNITVTSTPWPPSIPAAYNQSYIFVADSTNTDWAGVGTPSRTPNGIIDIQWIKRPSASLPITNAGVWYSANTTSQIYSAPSISDAYNNNKVVTGVIFPELEHTLTTDTFGTKADVIRAQPFVDGRISTNVGALTLPPNVPLNNSGGQVNSFVSATGVFNISQPSQAAIVSSLLASGNGIVQNTSGNWTLPSIPIFVSFTANPTLLQYSTITQISQNATNNVLTITIQAINTAYFQAVTYPANLFLAVQKFTFATPPQTEILRLASTVLPASSQSFAIRDDISYVCRDANNNGFSGNATADRATATITFALAVADGTNVTNIGLTFTSAVPSSFVNNTSIVVFSATGIFNITAALLTVSGSTYTFSGELNTVYNTSVLAGTYNVVLARAAKEQTLQGLVGNVNLTSQNQSVTVTVSGQNIDLSTAGGNSWVVGGNSFSETSTKKIGSLTANPLSIVTNNIEAINVSYGLSTTSLFTASGVGSSIIEGFHVMPSGYRYLYKDSNLYKSDTIGGSVFTSIRNIPNTNGGLAGLYSANVAVYPYVITNGGSIQGFIILTDTPSGSETITKVISPVLLTAAGLNYNTFQSFSVSPNGRNACVIMYAEGQYNCVALTNSFDTSGASVSFPTVIRNSQITNPRHAVYKDDNTLFVVGSGMDLYQMNVTTGAITSLGVTFQNETSVFIFYTNGALYISGYTGLYLVDQTTWRATKLSTYSIPGVDYWASVPFDRSRVKLFFGNATNNIYEFDATANVLVDGGNFQISDSTSVSLGNGSLYDVPLIAANEPTPTTLSAGRLGQVLKSRGPGKTPNWGDPSVPYSTNATVVQIVSTTAGTIGSDILSYITTAAPISATFTTRFNSLNLTVSADTGKITGWVANAVYKLTMTTYWATSTITTIRSYFSAVRNDLYPQSLNDYGDGVSTCGTRTGSDKEGDGIISSAVGFWVPTASTTPLNLLCFIAALPAGTTAKLYMVLLIEKFN